MFTKLSKNFLLDGDVIHSQNCNQNDAWTQTIQNRISLFITKLYPKSWKWHMTTNHPKQNYLAYRVKHLLSHFNRKLNQTPLYINQWRLTYECTSDPLPSAEKKHKRSFQNHHHLSFHDRHKSGCKPRLYDLSAKVNKQGPCSLHW